MSSWYKNLVKRLLEAKANLSDDVVATVTVGHPIAFFGAVENESVEVMRLLVERGQSVNCTDFWGNTALIKAVVMGKEKVCDFLMEHGANLTAVSNSGGNALFYALLGNRCSIVCKLLAKLNPDYQAAFQQQFCTTKASSSGIVFARQRQNIRDENTSMSPLASAITQ